MGYNGFVRHKRCNAGTGAPNTCPLYTERKLHTQPNLRHIAVIIIPPVLLFVQVYQESSALCFGAPGTDFHPRPAFLCPAGTRPAVIAPFPYLLLFLLSREKVMLPIPSLSWFLHCMLLP